MKELVGHYEAAEILGWKKQQVTVYMQRGKFPEPLQKLASGPIWYKEDIQKFKESRMKMKTLEELQAVVTDERVNLSEEKGMYYAIILEDNGDQHDLAQSNSIDDLHEQLKATGSAE